MRKGTNERDLAGNMKNCIEPASECIFHIAHARHIALEKMCGIGKVFTPTGREIVDNRDIMAIMQQAVDDVRADEAAATCNENTH
jgi:hypothetical protein